MIIFTSVKMVQNKAVHSRFANDYGWSMALDVMITSAVL